MAKHLKGDTFINRYRISGALTTESPLHVGSGAQDAKRLGESRRDDNGEAQLVAAVVKDASGKPYLPGSTLRGVLRHWLRDVLTPCGEGWAAEHDYVALGKQDQAAQGAAVRDSFSWLEVLFGTPLAAGKVEIWDAPCGTPTIPPVDTLLHWDARALTYVETSVAIDPATGTVLNRLLYNTEVVPRGVQFEVNLVGQNLDDVEVGLILLALEGFNSQVYPVTLGAKPGTGRGRLKWTPGRIERLTRAELPKWAQGVLTDALAAWAPAEQAATAAGGPAGYYALPELTDKERRELIAAVKRAAQFAPPAAPKETP